MVKSADILAVRGSRFFSRMILRVTKGEVSHVGMFISGDPPIILEALGRVVTRPLEDSLIGCEAAFLLSPINLPPQDRLLIVHQACRYSADTYGYFKIALFVLDAIFGTEWFTKHLAFTSFPICSWLVGKAYKNGAGLYFGEPEGGLTPQEILEFARANPDKYIVTKLL